jgi:hypothetical protein
MLTNLALLVDVKHSAIKIMQSVQLGLSIVFGPLKVAK